MIDPEEAKRRSRGISTDMSPQAILRRLEIVSELRNFALELGRGRFIGPAEEENSAGENERGESDGSSEADD